MKLPILVYNLQNESIKQHEFIDSKSYCIHSYQYFGIKILEGDAVIYSVKDPNTINTHQEFQTNENYHYTIYCKSNVVKFQVWNKYGHVGIITLYVKQLSEPEHYKDLLVNYKLPTYSELENCIIDENKAQLIKRLLIDYQTILRYKGTITSLEKFLNFIGFDPESIKIIAEYRTPNGERTIVPNKEVDTKTGYYHLLYDNYQEAGLTPKNMPLRLLNVTDVTELFEILNQAIALAHKYFLVSEQDISFFGINHSANSEQFLAIGSNHVMNHYQNPHLFAKNVEINLHKNYISNIHKQIIDNNIQKISSIENSEVKFILNSVVPNQELFIVDSEIIDDDAFEDDFVNYHRRFGNILHLSIASPNTYIKYNIKYKNNVFTEIVQDWVYINELPHQIIYYSLLAGEYEINISIKDGYNNTEEYFYSYTIEGANIDFDILNSSELLFENDITSDVDSPSKVTSVTDNPILAIDNVPADLSEYYELPDLTNAQFLTTNERYIPTNINANRTVKETTKLPIDFMDNWLQLIAIPSDGVDLRIKHYNPEFPNKYTYLSPENLILNDIEPDVLCIIELDVYDDPDDMTAESYYLITTQMPGVDILSLFEIVNYIDADNQTIIQDLPDYTATKIPVNYNFKLFPVDDSNYIYPPDTTKENPILINSIYPLLSKDIYTVLYGDIILCKINDKLIVENMNIVWNIYNSFNGELLFSTNDLTLKYRVQEQTVYDIEFIMVINSQEYKIYKKSIISSYA